MAAKKYAHRVSGAAAVVPVDGTERYLYKGAIVPASVDAEALKHLVAVGVVEKFEVLPEPTAASKSEPTAASKSEPTAASKSEPTAASKSEPDQPAESK